MPHSFQKLAVEGHVLGVHSTPLFILLTIAQGYVYVLKHDGGIIRILEIEREIVSENATLVVDEVNRIIIGDAGGVLSTWTLHNGVRQDNWHLRDMAVTAIAFVGTTKSLVVCYSDGLIQLVNSSRGTIIQDVRLHESSIVKLLYSPVENKVLSTSIGDELRIWTPAPSVQDINHHTVRTPVELLCWIGDAERIVATASRASLAIHIWNVVDGASISVLSPPLTTKRVVAIASYTLFGNANTLMSAHKDGSIRIWECNQAIQLYAFDTGKRVRTLLPVAVANAYTQGVETVHRIVTGHDSGVVKVWRIPAPHIDGSSYREALPTPRGEKIIKTGKKDKWFYGIADVKALPMVSGCPIGVSCLRLSSVKVEDKNKTPEEGSIANASSPGLRTDFHLCQFDENSW